jgi:hypothetical protein
MAGVRDPWRAIRELVRACSMRARSAAIRGSVFVIRDPWRASRVCFSVSWW